MQVFFFHGLESGPMGSKGTYLKDRFGASCPDFQGMDLDQRTLKATEILEGVDSCVIVGSSFGGLLASLMYQRYPDKIKGLVLCAPAFHRAEADPVKSLPCATTIIHGYRDEVVPWSAVDAKARQLGVTLYSVEDNHRLSYHHKLMGDELSKLLRTIEAT